MSTYDIALQYRESGFSFLPIRYMDKRPNLNRLAMSGNCTTGRGGVRGTWEELTTRLPTLEEIRVWFTGNKEANIGLIAGAVSGNIGFLDFDSLEAYNAWSEAINLDPDKAIQFTGKGIHVPVRLPIGEKIPNRRIFYEGVHVGELKGDNSYIVTSPSVHPNGNSYEWNVLPTQDNILTLNHTGEFHTVLGLDSVYTMGKRIKVSKYSRQTIGKEELRTLLHLLPAVYTDDYWLWSYVGMALKNTLSEDGFDLWIEFSKRNKDKFNLSVAISQWRSFREMPEGGYTVGSIIHWGRSN